MTDQMERYHKQINCAILDGKKFIDLEIYPTYRDNRDKNFDL